MSRKFSRGFGYALEQDAKGFRYRRRSRSSGKHGGVTVILSSVSSLACRAIASQTLNDVGDKQWTRCPIPIWGRAHPRRALLAISIVAI
jgi:hypothetical protein